MEWLFEGMKVKDVITWTEMVMAYMEFGLVNLALKVFDEMPEKNFVSYNTILAGLCQNEQGFEAMMLFVRMVEEGLELMDQILHWFLIPFQCIQMLLFIFALACTKF